MENSHSADESLEEMRARIDASIACNDLANSEFDLNIAIRLYPDDYNFQANLADILYRKGDYEQAKTRYEFMSSRFPEYHWGEIGLANLEILESRYDEALERLKKIISRDEDFISAYIIMLRIYRSVGDYDNAYTICKTVIAKDPLNEEAATFMRESEHNILESRADIDDLASPQDKSKHRYFYSQTSTREDHLDIIRFSTLAVKDPKKYEQLLPSYIDKFSDDADLLGVYADIAFGRGDYEEAIERFSLFNSRFPDLPWGQFGIARAEKSLGRTDDAERRLEKLLVVYSDFIPALTILSDLKIKKGDLDGLRKIWDAALDGPTDPIVLYKNYIEALLRCGEAISALNVLRDARRRCDLEGYKALAQLENRIFSSSPVWINKNFIHSSSPRTQVRAERLRSRLETNTLFDAVYYSQNKPDGPIAPDQAIDHFVEWGNFARLQTYSRSAIARVIGWEEDSFEEHKTYYLDNLENSQINFAKYKNFLDREKIGVFLHSQANYYMKPIAECLCAALQSVGADANLMSELDEGAEDISIPIVIAPHEFFGFSLPEYFQSEAFAKIYIAYNTEQLPSKWFKDCFADIVAARAVIDVNFQSHVIFSRFMPSLYCFPPIAPSTWRHHVNSIDPGHPQLQSLDRSIIGKMGQRPDFDDRPLDLFFAGYSTPERDQVFIRNISYFSDKNCFLAYAKKGGESVISSKENKSVFSNNLGVCGLSKILLNIHRFSIGYFEWERMMAQGFLAGSCVVTTPSLRSPFFEPGVHYFEAPSRHLGLAVEWLLETEEGRDLARNIVTEATKVLDQQLTQERIGRQLICFLGNLSEVK